MPSLHYPEIYESLLASRGLTLENVDEFLNPDYKKLHDPLLLPDMEKARDRVIKAMKNNEHIVVFSDYDADGIPGAVVMADFFNRAKYSHASFYIPHRHDEGFGLNCEAIDVCVERGATLLITVDCGIADLEEVKYANSKGIEVIVTDHHEPKSVLPEAYAVVDPKRKDLPAGKAGSNYPFKELCGAAMAFKFVQAILRKERFGIVEGMEKWSLDMVGIATLSDMVPLIDENRIFAKFGMDVLRKSPRPGLAALFRKLNINQKYLTEEDVTFMITPRINAASRMGVPMDAFLLLSTTDILEAEKLAIHLEKINNERKGIVASLVKEAKGELAKREEINKVIVIGNPEWRPALLGLVANSLVEEYSRPVFVWGRDGDNILKGSCRSFNGVDLCLLMDGASHSFIAYGGHTGAGGFELDLEHIGTLEASLSKVLENTIVEEKKNEESEEIIKAELSHINPKMWDMVSGFAPFGLANPKPVFFIEEAEIYSAKNFGKAGNHLEVIFRPKEGRNIKAIQFFTTIEDTPVSLEPGNKVSLKAHLEKSYFMNRPELRLRIIDIIER